VTLEGVRAVLFDVDGTLYRQTPVRLAMALELAALPVAGRGPREVRRIVSCLREYRRAHEELRTARPRHPDVARRQLELAAERSGTTVTFAAQTVADWMCRQPLKYVRLARRPGIDRLLARLSERGLALGVLSDYDPRAKLAALGLERYFSIMLCTTDPEIDALKPDPRGFLRAATVWGVAPGEILYVGDRPEVDAAGARAAGLACVIIGRADRGAGRDYSRIDLERLAAAG
jgi:HAD superfamily hydrolase (TIGR01509 family)